MDEKAFEAAMDAYGRTPGIGSALKAAITAYEQARERVAVPTQTAIMAGLDKAQQDTWLASSERIHEKELESMADYVLTLLRHAPSAQPWTRELAKELFDEMWEMMDPNHQETGDKSSTCTPDSLYEAGLRVLDGPTAPVASAQCGEPDEWMRVGKREVLIGAKWVYELTSRGIIIISSGGGPDKPLVKADLERVERAVNALPSELAAERAAHRLTADAKRVAMERAEAEVSRLKQERDNLDAELATVTRDRYECERELESLRELHERDVASASEAKRMISERETKIDRLKQELAEHRECVALARCEPNPAHEPIRSFEEWLSEMAEHGPDDLLGNWPRQAKMALEEMAKCLEDERASNADQFARIAELERERDEALKASSDWQRRAQVAVRANVELRRERIELGHVGATQLKRELEEARAKLEALRDACELTDVERDSYEATAEPHPSEKTRRIPVLRGALARIQSALAQESAKPAEPKAEPWSDDAETRHGGNAYLDGLSVPWMGCSVMLLDGHRTIVTHADVADRETGQTTRVSRTRRLTTDAAVPPDEIRAECLALLLHELDENIKVRGVRALDPHRLDEPAKPAEPKPGDEVDATGMPVTPMVRRAMAKFHALTAKPGDVLSGEAAKAYMLANPGRRVARDIDKNAVYEARRTSETLDGILVVLRSMSGETWTRINDFNAEGHIGKRYIVLPPEPVKPAPDLDLAGRVGRVEKAARVFLAAAARQTTSARIAFAASDALKALEGGGSNG